MDLFCLASHRDEDVNEEENGARVEKVNRSRRNFGKEDAEQRHQRVSELTWKEGKGKNEEHRRCGSSVTDDDGVMKRRHAVRVQ